MQAGGDWAAVARCQAGAITRSQLRTSGLADHRVDHLVESKALVPITAGVFAVRGSPGMRGQALWAAVHATRGVVGFASAAALWAVIDTEPALVHVIVPHSRRVTVPLGVRVYRGALPSVALARLDGLPVTSRQWTLLDHLGRLHRSEAQRLADRAFQRGWLTPDAVADRLRRYPGRTGNTTLRLILDRSGDRAAAQSERILHRLLRRAGVRDWTANHPIRSNGVVVAVADVAVVGHRLVIEIDGWAYHSDVDRFQRDRRRQNLLVGLGWRVLRFTWADLTERPAYVLDAIRSELGRHHGSGRVCRS